MAVSGLPEPCESPAMCIARLALDIMDLSKEVLTEEGDVVVSSFNHFAVWTFTSIFHIKLSTLSKIG